MEPWLGSTGPQRLVWKSWENARRPAITPEALFLVVGFRTSKLGHVQARAYIAPRLQPRAYNPEPTAPEAYSP